MGINQNGRAAHLPGSAKFGCYGPHALYDLRGTVTVDLWGHAMAISALAFLLDFVNARTGGGGGKEGDQGRLNVCRGALHGEKLTLQTRERERETTKLCTSTLVIRTL